MILTDDEIDNIRTQPSETLTEFARAIEAAILEKIGEPYGFIDMDSELACSFSFVQQDGLPVISHRIAATSPTVRSTLSVSGFPIGCLTSAVST